MIDFSGLIFTSAYVVFITAKIAPIFIPPSAFHIHIFTVIYSPLNWFFWNQHNDQLPVGLLAQLVRHWLAIPLKKVIIKICILTTSEYGSDLSNIPIVHAHDVSKQIPREKKFLSGWKCYKTMGSYVSCAFIEIRSTWEIWWARKMRKSCSLIMVTTMERYQALAVKAITPSRTSNTLNVAKLRLKDT